MSDWQLINRLGTNDKEIGLIAEAAQLYLDLVTFAWGILPITAVFKPGATEADRDKYPLYVDNTPTVDGAEGFHDLGKDGKPYAEVFLSTVPNGEFLHDASGAGQSLAGVITHELAEGALDAFANEWCALQVKDPEGSRVYNLLAKELSDPVQNFAFTVKTQDGTVVDCSDFVYPAYFSPQGGLRFDHMRIATAPGEVTSGGYAIVANESQEGQVFAKGSPLTQHRPLRIFHATDKPPVWREAMYYAKKRSRSKRRLGV